MLDYISNQANTYTATPLDSANSKRKFPNIDRSYAISVLHACAEYSMRGHQFLWSVSDMYAVLIKWNKMKANCFVLKNSVFFIHDGYKINISISYSQF